MSGDCHDCTCFISAPCSDCENCAHWDVTDCPNDCQTCERNHNQ